MMEDSSLSEGSGVIRTEETNIPFPVYQEIVPKTPFPKTLILSVREDHEKYRLGIKDIIPWD